LDERAPRSSFFTTIKKAPFGAFFFLILLGI